MYLSRSIICVAALGLACIGWYFVVTYKHQNYHSLHMTLLNSTKEKLPTSPLTINDYKLMSRTEIKGLVQERYHDRLKTLENFCAKSRELRQLDYRWYHLEAHTLLVCLNPKAGTTSLKNFLAASLIHMREREESGNKDNTGKKVSEKELRCSHEQLEVYKKRNDTFAFTMVRHPLSHLVSAYQQFVSMKHDHLTKFINQSSTDQPLTPSQMVNHILTYPEWMQHMVHFNPYSSNCDLCHSNIKLDAILKMETWDEDMAFISDVLQIKELSYKFAYNSHKRLNMSDVTKWFFSNISRDQFDKVIEFYRTDFEMFGYDPTPYYEYYNTPNT